MANPVHSFDSFVHLIVSNRQRCDRVNMGSSSTKCSMNIKKDSWNYYLNTGWYFNQWVRVVVVEHKKIYLKLSPKYRSIFQWMGPCSLYDCSRWCLSLIFVLWLCNFHRQLPVEGNAFGIMGSVIQNKNAENHRSFQNCRMFCWKLEASIHLLYNRIRNSVWVNFSSFLPVAYHFAIGNTSTNGQFPNQLLLDYLSFVYATLHLATTGNTFPYTRWLNSCALDTPVKRLPFQVASHNFTIPEKATYRELATCNLIYNLLKVSTSASGNFLEASFYFWWTQPAKKMILVKLFDHFPKIAVIR